MNDACILFEFVFLGHRTSFMKIIKFFIFNVDNVGLPYKGAYEGSMWGCVVRSGIEGGVCSSGASLSLFSSAVAQLRKVPPRKPDGDIKPYSLMEREGKQSCHFAIIVN